MIMVNIYKKNARKFYYWLEDDDAPRKVHSKEDDSWFISKRNGSAYDEVSVDKNVFMWSKGHTVKIEKTCGYQFA